MPRLKGQVARTFSKRMRREHVAGYDRARRARRGRGYLKKHNLHSSHISNWRQKLNDESASSTKPKARHQQGKLGQRAPVIDVERVKTTAGAALRYHQAQVERLTRIVDVLNTPVI